MTQKTEWSHLLLLKKEFPSSVIFLVICFGCILSLDCQSRAGLMQCFGQELPVPAGSWHMPSLSRHCLKENDFISWTEQHEFESYWLDTSLFWNAASPTDAPAAVHLLILSISLLSFTSASFFESNVYFLEAQALELQDLFSPIDWCHPSFPSVFMGTWSRCDLLGHCSLLHTTPENLINEHFCEFSVFVDVLEMLLFTLLFNICFLLQACFPHST